MTDRAIGWYEGRQVILDEHGDPALVNGMPVYVVAGGATDRSITVHLRAAVQSYQAGMRSAAASTTAFGSRVATVGAANSQAFTIMGAAAIGAGALILKGLHGAGEAARDFEAELLKLQTQVGLSEAEMRELGDAALALRGTGVGAQELAEAAFFVASAGLRGADALDALRVSAELSALGLGETAVVADLVTSAMNAYGSEVLSAAEAGDILIGTVREGKAEAAALAASMGRVLPFASALEVSFNEVGAAMAAMTRTGTDASTAATQLRALMSQIIGPSKGASEALAELAESSDLSFSSFEQMRQSIEERGLRVTLEELATAIDGNVTVTKDLFSNTRAVTAVLDVFGKNAAANMEIFDRMNDVAGLTAEGMEALSRDAEHASNRFSASMEAMKITVGQAVLPVLARLAEAGTGLVEIFLSLPGPLQDTISWMAGLGGVLLVVGGAASILAPRIGALKAQVVGLIGTARGLGGFAMALRGLGVGAVIGGIIHLTQRIADMRAEAAEKVRIDIETQGFEDAGDKLRFIQGRIRGLREEIKRDEEERRARFVDPAGASGLFGLIDKQKHELNQYADAEADLTRQILTETNTRAQAHMDEADLTEFAMTSMQGDLEGTADAYEGLSEEARKSVDELRKAAVEQAVTTKAMQVDTETSLDMVGKAWAENTRILETWVADLDVIMDSGNDVLAFHLRRMGPETAAPLAREAAEAILGGEGLGVLPDRLRDLLAAAKLSADQQGAKWPQNFGELGSAAVAGLIVSLEQGLEGVEAALGKAGASQTVRAFADGFREMAAEAGLAIGDVVDELLIMAESTNDPEEALRALTMAVRTLQEEPKKLDLDTFDFDTKTNAVFAKLNKYEALAPIADLLADGTQASEEVARTIAKLFGITEAEWMAIIQARDDGSIAQVDAALNHAARDRTSTITTVHRESRAHEGTNLMQHDGGPIKHRGGLLRHRGGAIERMHMGGIRPDERWVLAQRGEFMMQRSAVQKLGRPLMEAINEGGVPHVPMPVPVHIPSPQPFDVERLGSILRDALGDQCETRDRILSVLMTLDPGAVRGGLEEAILETVRKAVRIQGGNVQSVLGPGGAGVMSG